MKSHITREDGRMAIGEGKVQKVSVIQQQTQQQKNGNLYQPLKTLLYLWFIPARTPCHPNSLKIQNPGYYFHMTPTKCDILALSLLALYLGRHTDTLAGSVLCLAHSFISPLGLCEVWQPISARTPETALIFSHRSCLCTVCSSAKECQVKLLWPSTGPVLSPNPPYSNTPWGTQRQACLSLVPSLPRRQWESHWANSLGVG